MLQRLAASTNVAALTAAYQMSTYSMEPIELTLEVDPKRRRVDAGATSVYQGNEEKEILRNFEDTLTTTVARQTGA